MSNYNRRHCSDHTEVSEAVTRKEEERKKEIRENIYGVLGVIGFFILMAIVGTIEQMPM